MTREFYLRTQGENPSRRRILKDLAIAGGALLGFGVLVNRMDFTEKILPVQSATEEEIETWYKEYKIKDWYKKTIGKNDPDTIAYQQYVNQMGGNPIDLSFNKYVEIVEKINEVSKLEGTLWFPIFGRNNEGGKIK